MQRHWLVVYLNSPDALSVVLDDRHMPPDQCGSICTWSRVAVALIRFYFIKRLTTSHPDQSAVVEPSRSPSLFTKGNNTATAEIKI